MESGGGEHPKILTNSIPSPRTLEPPKSIPGRNRPHRKRGGAGLRFRQETAQLTKLVVRRSIYQSLVWAAAQANRQQELAIVFHIHLVLDLDVIAVDKTGRRAEL